MRAHWTDSSNLELKAKIPDQEAITKVVTIFRELRAGQTLDGKNKVKTPSGVLSTAEAISLLANSMALSGNFGDGNVSDNDLASGLQGAVIKDDVPEGALGVSENAQRNIDGYAARRAAEMREDKTP